MVGAMVAQGVTTQAFPTTLIKIPIYIYINIYFIAILRDEIKKLGKQQSDRADDLMSWAS
jgi:hypothetical protein